MFHSTFVRASVVAFAAVAVAACGDDDPIQVDDPTIIEVADQAGTFTTLLAAVEAAGLTSTLEGEGPFTVFENSGHSPPEEEPGKVASFLSEFFDGCIGVNLSRKRSGRKALSISVDGGSVMVDGSNVIATDIEAGNGIIHVIDDVLFPEPILDLVQTAEKAGTFTTLLAALDATSLTPVLKGDGPFTVFAPTDAAFAALPEGTLEALLADPETLASILTYHVVAGSVTSDQVVTLSGATTVNGADVSISVDGSTVLVNDAEVIAVYVVASNGVIHGIDKVILPPMM